MNPTQPAVQAPADDEYSDLGRVLVDSGHILIVDPCHLPPELLRKLTTPNAYGVTVGTLVATPCGDGAYPVEGGPYGLAVVDPYSNPDDPDTRPGGGWGYYADGNQLADIYASADR